MDFLYRHLMVKVRSFKEWMTLLFLLLLWWLCLSIGLQKHKASKRQLLAPMLRRSNMFQLFKPIANWVEQRQPPAGGQQRALCCCGAWSRARWRRGGWRPRPAAAGEARSAFGLQRAQTGEAGVRGRRLGLQSHQEEEEVVVEQLVWWRQQARGLKPGTNYI